MTAEGRRRERPRRPGVRGSRRGDFAARVTEATGWGPVWVRTPPAGAGLRPGSGCARLAEEAPRWGCALSVWAVRCALPAQLRAQLRRRGFSYRLHLFTRHQGCGIIP